jgi:hypothetical protein
MIFEPPHPAPSDPAHNQTNQPWTARSSTVFPLALTVSTWLNPRCSVEIGRPPTLRVPTVPFLGPHETREIVRPKRIRLSAWQKERRQGSQASAQQGRAAPQHRRQLEDRRQKEGGGKNRSSQKARTGPRLHLGDEILPGPESGPQEEDRRQESRQIHPGSRQATRATRSTGPQGSEARRNRGQAHSLFTIDILDAHASTASALPQTSSPLAGSQPEEHHGRLQEEKDRRLTHSVLRTGQARPENASPFDSLQSRCARARSCSGTRSNPDASPGRDSGQERRQGVGSHALSPGGRQKDRNA